MIDLKRKYLKCRCGQDGSYAADSLLGISGSLSLTVQKHACSLAAGSAFLMTSRHLEELLGVRVCAETIRTMVQRHGQAMTRFQLDDETTHQQFRDAPGEVEFTVDAGKVCTHEEGWKDLKIGVIQKRATGEPVSVEQWDQQRLPTATMVLAFAMIAAAKVFRKSWRRRFRALGVKAFGTLQALADGAGWIWKSFDRAWTGCVQTLDIYHACEHLSKAAGQIFGDGTKEAQSAFERGRSYLLASGWNGVCQWVAELLDVEEAKERERRTKITEKVIGYFVKHSHRLAYAQRLADGRAIGSGAVEGWAKTLGLRLKCRGARWKRKNVQPMATLVCVRQTRQWNAYWANAM